MFNIIRSLNTLPPYQVIMKSSPDQVIPQNTWTTISGWEAYPGGMYGGIPVSDGLKSEGSGLVNVSVSVTIAGSTTLTRQLRIYLNGTTLIGTGSIGSGTVVTAASDAPVEINADDVISVQFLTSTSTASARTVKAADTVMTVSEAS